MKKLFFFLLPICLLFAQDYTFSLLKDKKPTNELYDLLSLYNLSTKRSLEEVLDITQENWLRKKERWRIKENKPQKKEDLLKILKKIGCLDEINPQYQKYDQAFLFGSLVQIVEDRLEFLIKKYKEGLRFDMLVFLGSERPLDESFELSYLRKNYPEEILPQTEIEMIEFVFAHTTLPKELAKIEKLSVSAPNVRENGKYKRANTLDTIRLWLKKYPVRKKCLFISNQPFIGYQNAVVHVLLPKDIYAETIGSAVSFDYPSDIYLDMVTRWLYLETFLLKKSTFRKINLF